jgi:hypothetical protein
VVRWPGDPVPRERLRFESGLSNNEFDRVEATFGFRFPPDLRTFLSLGLPAGRGCPDWRSGSEEELRSHLDQPACGICFDVEHDSFWLETWGPRPANLDDALALARRQISAAPTLIPIFGHRFIPDEPADAGNPVFSVHQSDAIYYGADLREYLEHEFRDSTRAARDRRRANWEPRTVRFWSDLVDTR